MHLVPLAEGAYHINVLLLDLPCDDISLKVLEISKSADLFVCTASDGDINN